jgi:hypothetical protein
MMKVDNKIVFSLRAYFLILFIEGILSFVGLLLIPSDPKNAWLLGFSKSRFVMLLIASLLIIVIGIITVLFFRDKVKLQKIEFRIKSFLETGGNQTIGFVVSLFGVVGGIIFLNNTFTTSDLFLTGYYIRLAPWILWFSLLCAQTVFFLIFRDPANFIDYFLQHGKALIILIIILIAGIFIHAYLWEVTPEDWDVNKLFNFDDKFNIYKQDIYAVFREGENLLAGVNPYSRVHLLGSDLTWNFEIPTYFPIFYCLNWFVQKIGFQDFFYWLDLWKVFFLLANLGITFIIFYIPYHRYKNLGFAVLGALFWLFNRWTLHITMIYHIDFIAIFFLVLSLILWPRYRVASLISFGLSLGIKQIAIFMFPLYCIWIWQLKERQAWKRNAVLTSVLFGFPLLYISPFLMWDAGGFIKSILLSATRNAESHFGIPSLDALLILSGIPAKIPMLLLMVIIFILAWKRKVNHFIASLMIMLVFVNFNSVLFRQYMTWVAALIPLALSSALVFKGRDCDSEN